jgi:hypothetical protein
LCYDIIPPSGSFRRKGYICQEEGLYMAGGRVIYAWRKGYICLEEAILAFIIIA